LAWHLLTRRNGCVLKVAKGLLGRSKLCLGARECDGIVHDDDATVNNDHDESDDDGTNSGPVQQTLADAGIYAQVTVTDGDGDTAVSRDQIGDQLVFEDDGPATGVENLVGSGTSDPQFGTWSASFGADGPYVSDGTVDPIAVTINSFTIGSTTYSSPEITDLTLESIGAGGEYYLSGTLLADFDVSGTVDEVDEADAIEFTMVFNPDGTYIFNLSGGFGTTFTQSTDDGQLPSGGPDPVQTLKFDPFDTVENDVIFYAVDYDNVIDAQLLESLGLIEEDLNKDGTPLNPGNDIDPNQFLYNWINGDWGMNVGDQGFGVNNNNMNGYNDPALNESFVINPDRDVRSFELEISGNGGPSYQYTVDGSGNPTPTSDVLEYRLIYATPDGNGEYFSEWFVVTDDDLETREGTSSEFITLDARGTDTRLIDGVQVVMTNGEVKISTISFTIEDGVIADPVSIDMTATVTDGDGDTASDSFTVSLEADIDPFNPPDLLLEGTDLAIDTFNVDFATTNEAWWIGNGVATFEDGTDKIMLLNPYAPIVIGASGGDATITVGTGNNATVVTVYGANGDLVLGDDVLVAYSDLLIDGTLNFASETSGDATFTGGTSNDAFVADGDVTNVDIFDGGEGADVFVFFDDVDGGTTINGFDEDDKIIISASGFGGNGFEEGILDATLFSGSGDLPDGVLQTDYFFFKYDEPADTGELYFDSNPEDGTNTPVLIASFTSLEFAIDEFDIFVIA
jgi:hypothetical protein